MSFFYIGDDAGTDPRYDSDVAVLRRRDRQAGVSSRQGSRGQPRTMLSRSTLHPQMGNGETHQT